VTATSGAVGVVLLMFVVGSDFRREGGGSGGCCERGMGKSGEPGCDVTGKGGGGEDREEGWVFVVAGAFGAGEGSDGAVAAPLAVEVEVAVAVAAAAAAAAPEPEGLRMILRTPVPPSVFLCFGSVPNGAILSRTPNRISPASSKLALLCTGGSSHLSMNARDPPSLVEARGISPPVP
jgi:hypothetical protein